MAVVPAVMTSTTVLQPVDAQTSFKIAVKDIANLKPPESALAGDFVDNLINQYLPSQ
jgi:hypothetical protein